MNDRSASSDTGGGAATAFTSPGLSTNVASTGRRNNAIESYRTAIRIMTDEWSQNTNILAIPGIRDKFVTDLASDLTRDYGLSIFIRDPIVYDENTTRLFGDATDKADVRTTAEQLDGETVDNNYVTTYFPDVVINDNDNNKKVRVPASIAAIAAFAFNDKTGFSWFAPAGFNRGALDFVSSAVDRLNKGDRDRLQDSKINPIASFPLKGTTPSYVIFGQKTLQAAKSALDRVNVRRLLLEIKRLVVDITKDFVFEQNDQVTRDRWITRIIPRLALIQVNAGLESFKVTMDSSNNSSDDVESNKLNGRISLVPTRTVEFISIDFIITNSGVSFEE